MTTQDTKQQILKRIINQEVFVNASQFVSELANDERYMEDLIPASVADNYREPVEDAIRNGTPAMLMDICDRLGYELQNSICEGLETKEDAEQSENNGAAIDRTGVIKDIAADENWEEVADHLDIEPFTIEALQHWLVSDWLADQLEDINALVARDVLGFEIWGRTECGQGLEQDSDLNRVADALIKRHRNFMVNTA